MARKGGFACICRGCASRTGEGISLFSIPRDPIRAKMWLRASNREDILDLSVDDLHNNYRLCENHFEGKYISKGNVRKTLFVKAVPTIFSHTLKRERICGDEESDEAPRKVIIFPANSIGSAYGEQEATSDTKAAVNDSLECSSNIADISIIPLEESTEATIVPASPSCSPIAGLSGIHTSPRKSPTLPPSSSCATQTPASLSSNSPRKKKLRQKIKALRRRKLEVVIIEQSSLENFHKHCDKYLSEHLSSFVKDQATLQAREPSGRRYSI